MENETVLGITGGPSRVGCGGPPVVIEIHGRAAVVEVMNPRDWRDVIDGWMVRTQVRRDLMVALGMVLLSTVVVVALLTGFLVQPIAGGAVLAASAGGLVARRLRKRG
ncbi:hypothetical protein GCM10010178_25420 [Lentzea flava]|uniref:Uncharacterized protein n=1 Tax=Lentzea flava TaxID=103732 RepID=A0ABQ2UGP4_9PSEU|nr:hypothetical protein GCM10010178_25420 [Lentzea flava]